MVLLDRLQINRFRINTHTACLAWLLVPSLAYAQQTPVAAFIEPPFLQSQLADGQLAPLRERLPQSPAIVTFSGNRKPGHYGGDLTLLMARAKDVRQIMVYGYARLVGYDRQYRLVPDLLENYRVSEDATTYEFDLRPGHRWSDGSLFTTEDFRYFWEDVALNKELSPIGPPQDLMVDGILPEITILDATSIRYRWPHPYPDFLNRLAGPMPLNLFRPAHYMRQFHKDYADPTALAQRVKQSGRRSWAALHNASDNLNKNDNPDLPTLQPWVLKTKAPAQRFVFQRNPYYHRIDSAGRQLPYINQIILIITSSGLIPAKAGTGGSDLQARYLSFDDYTFLRDGEEKYDYQVRLWQIAKGAHLALFPNLNAKDPVWRNLLRDVRFRRALSLATNRYEINRVVYFGLAVSAQNTVLRQSPLYRSDYAFAFTEFDLDHANQLLDEIGLTRPSTENKRFLPDGRPLEIIVETANPGPDHIDVLQLIQDSWRELGIKLHIKPVQLEILRNRIFAGHTLMALGMGLENGIPTASMSPAELAPTDQQQWMWPYWGEYYQTKGWRGQAIDMKKPQDLLALHHEWKKATSLIHREQIWHKMLAIHANQLYSIGLISGVLQPILVTNKLRNIPVEGIYNWDPGAHFGLYRPDQFWLSSKTHP